MFINSFWVGVFATVFVELSGLFVWSIVTLVKRGKRYDH